MQTKEQLSFLLGCKKEIVSEFIGYLEDWIDKNDKDYSLRYAADIAVFIEYFYNIYASLEEKNLSKEIQEQFQYTIDEMIAIYNDCFEVMNMAFNRILKTFEAKIKKPKNELNKIQYFINTQQPNGNKEVLLAIANF